MVAGAKKHTLKWKKAELEEIASLAKKSKVVALVKLERLPASLSQRLRKDFSGKARLRVSKRRVIKKALENAGLYSPALDQFIQGQVGVMFTDIDPFELYSKLKKKRLRMPVRAGTVAESDIVVEKGDTGLPPGPDLADLKAAGIDVQLKGSTIKIEREQLLVKQGEKVSPAVAKALAKLEVKPLEVGLNIVAAMEGGQLFEASVLDIDAEEVFSNLAAAHNKAINLAFNAQYPAKPVVVLLLQKGFSDARGVALEAGIFNKETMPALLTKADAAAKHIKSLVKDVGKKEEKAEEAREEKKSEEAAEERKKNPGGRKEKKK